MENLLFARLCWTRFVYYVLFNLHNKPEERTDLPLFYG